MSGASDGRCSRLQRRRGDVDRRGHGRRRARRGARARAGSPQWRTDSAVSSIGRGAEGSTATLLLKRTGAIVDATVVRGVPPAKFIYPPIGEVEPGIWLIDLSRAEPTELEAMAATLASAASSSTCAAIRTAPRTCCRT